MKSGSAYIYDYFVDPSQEVVYLFGKSPEQGSLTFKYPLTPTDFPDNPFREIDIWIDSCPGVYVDWTAETSEFDIIIGATFTPSAREFPVTLSTASLDIETSCFGNKLYCIGIHYQDAYCELSKVFMLATEAVADQRVQYFESETQLLTAFCNWFRAINPDILIGWHIHEFDLKFILDRCIANNVPFNLGRRYPTEFTNQNTSPNQIPGVVILDGADSLNILSIPLDGQSLEAVSQQYLGEGKLIAPEADKVFEIERMYKYDPHALALYNLKDAELVTKIVKTLNLIPTLISLSNRLNSPLKLSLEPIKAIEIPYARKLRATHPLMTPMPDTSLVESSTFKVKTKSGLFHSVLVFDLEFPMATIAEITNTDPLSLLLPGESGLFQDLLNRHKHTQYDESTLATSYLKKYFEKMIRSSRSQFYTADVKTPLKRMAYKWLRDVVTSFKTHHFVPILLESGRIYLISADPTKPVEPVESIENTINEKLRLTYPSPLPVRLKMIEKINYLYIAKSKYWADQRYPLIFKGLTKNSAIEIIKFGEIKNCPSFPKFGQRLVQGIFETLFLEKSVNDWCDTTISELKSGRYDTELMFSKRIKKSPKRYGIQAPPHIVAARVAKKFSGKIQYYYSESGPYPVLPSIDPAPINYDYYISTYLDPIVSLITETHQPPN